MTNSTALLGDAYKPDSAYAWRRLAIALVISSISGVGFWSAIVSLPVIETEFGVDRGTASLPYTAAMLGLAVGGVMMGRLSDRVGIMMPIMFGAGMLGIGYFAAAQATSLWQFILAQTIPIAMLGSSAAFGPLVADMSHWFVKRRGIAVAIVASGNYVAGTIWPPIIQFGIETVGWRQTYVGIGLICVTTIIPLALLLRRRSPVDDHVFNQTGAVSARISQRVSPRMLQAILVVAGLACCIAMSMPQVHIVAYCGDLGYGAARGAEMLSLMLALGVASRLISGFIADRIGGVGTLLLGSTLQCVALLFYLPFDGLVSLYVVSALFGLAQGGIVPSYALVVREYFPAREAGARVSIVFMATVVGMAIGGWMSGEIYDLTGSYQAAFMNGIAFNLLNMAIAFWLLMGRIKLRTSAA